MEAMDRVTFVQGVFCGVLLTVLGFAVFGPSHHGAVAHGTETGDPQPAVEERHPDVAPQHAPVAPQPTPVVPQPTPVAPQPTAITPPPAAAEAREYDLNWSGYDGTGDPMKANYTLDGKALGSGEAGLDALRNAISHLPAGSKVRVATYYSAEPVAGVRKQYPFDVAKLQKLAEGHQVKFEVRAAW